MPTVANFDVPGADGHYNWFILPTTNDQLGESWEAINNYEKAHSLSKKRRKMEDPVSRRVRDRPQEDYISADDERKKLDDHFGKIHVHDSWHFWMFVMKYNLTIPANIIAWRLSITLQTSDVIVGKMGRDTGVTLYRDAMVTMAENGPQMQVQFTLRLMLAAIIKEQKNVLLKPAVKFDGYHGGLGITVDDVSRHMRSTGTYLRQNAGMWSVGRNSGDIIPTFVPYNFKPRTFWMDFTGIAHPDILSENDDTLDYPTAEVYAAVYNIPQPINYIENILPDETPDTWMATYATLAMREYSEHPGRNSPTSGTHFTNPVLGTSPLGRVTTSELSDIMEQIQWVYSQKNSHTK